MPQSLVRLSALKWDLLKIGIYVQIHAIVFSSLIFPLFLLQESQFNVKGESPSSGGPSVSMGEEQDTSPSKLSKEELIQSMDRVDREIAKVEQQISKLKKKQVRTNYYY